MDDDEKEARRLQAILDQRLVFAGEAMSEDVLAFIALLAIQALPIFGRGLVGSNFGFFWVSE